MDLGLAAPLPINDDADQPEELLLTPAPLTESLDSARPADQETYHVYVHRDALVLLAGTALTSAGPLKGPDTGAGQVAS